MTETRLESLRAPYGTGAGADEVRAAFQSGAFPVAVYGLGKMGLPLAGVFAEASGNVIGADIDPDVVASVNDGQCHVKGEPGLDGLLHDVVADEAMSATTEPREAAEEASIHVVIVPTPITEEKEPDLAILSTVVEEIGRGLSPGDLVLIECTVPPGTTSEQVRSKLELRSGLSANEFGLAFCPERTMSGRALEDIRGAYPKVVGGIDEESTEVAAAIYEAINSNGVIKVSDATTAEGIKVFEGVYRDVNIALANELATFADELGMDVREAIEVANTQPFCHLHDPGPGVGGHCIPFYPYFLIRPFETETPLLEAARGVNDAMPRFTVEKLREEFAAEGTPMEETTVAVLGLTYRPGVEEIRASPALGIAEELSALGVDVFGVDPVLDDVDEFALEHLEMEELYDRSIDAIVSVTPHEEFETIDWEAIERETGEMIVIDGRDSLSLSESDHRVYTIGSGHD